MARWCIHKVFIFVQRKEDKRFWVNCKLNHELQKIITDNWTYGSVNGKIKGWPKNRRNRLILWDCDKTVNNGGHSTSVMRLSLEFDFLKYNKQSCRTSKTAGWWTQSVNSWGNHLWNEWLDNNLWNEWLDNNLWNWWFSFFISQAKYFLLE